MKLILVQWQIHNQSFFTWPFCIKFGLKIRFVDQNMKPKRVLYAGHVGPHFRGGILDFWSYLLELHGKKCRTILKILPWNLKFMSIYELVVLNTSNGFFLYLIWSKTWYFAVKKVTIFIQIPTELLPSSNIYCYDLNSHVIFWPIRALSHRRHA